MTSFRWNQPQTERRWPRPRLPGVANLREKLIDAAGEMITTSGWSNVTMGALAKQVGVSRQTVYNEIGTKPNLAEAMVFTELARFLGIVEEAFDTQGDLGQAIEHAVHDVLAYAADNKLLHAVVSATHGADTEILPLLTTHSSVLLEGAKDVVRQRVAPYAEAGALSVTTDDLEAGVDVIVRVVLSHVMAPSATPSQTAAALASIARRVLGI